MIQQNQVRTPVTCVLRTFLATLGTNSAIFPFSAELLCDFENENQCNFEVSTDDTAPSLYMWKRYNSKELEENSIPGPSGDYADLKDRYYMIASDLLAGNEGLQGAVTQLKSPLFNAGEHPLECFAFWFFFGVSNRVVHE